jgi:2-polyprenyl-6-methoxyphenol hydroxylase-like FAD-dependent oxidoreductase
VPAIRSALVIGGGIAGPTTAAALAAAGIEATVCEAYPAASNGIGSALALAPNGVAALDLIGAGDRVRSAALPITATEMSVGDRVLGALPQVRDVEPLRMVDRGDLHRILHDVAAAAGVRFAYDRRLVGVHEEPDAVTARFADGSTATADILIGADGVRSTVRGIIDPQAPPAGYTGLLGFGAEVPADITGDLLGDSLGDIGTMTFAFGRQAYYLYWRTAADRVTWGMNMPAPYLSTAQARETPTVEWLRRLRELYAGDHPGEMLAAATTPETLEVLGAIHIMPPLPHWYRDRLVLVGDAVHAPSNSTGQGGSLAIESGIELARCLRDLPYPATAFATYVGLRRARVEKITRRGRRANHSKTPGPIGRRIMRVAMPLAFRMMNPEKMLGPEYRYRIPWDTRITTSV